MSAVSISQFDWRLVNQQRQINDHVFRLCDSSKYLTTLGSNISPCQKATTLILKSLHNSSFHRWKKFQKYFEHHRIFVLDAFQNLRQWQVSLNHTCHTILAQCDHLTKYNLHFILALYLRWLIKKDKNVKNFRDFM